MTFALLVLLAGADSKPTLADLEHFEAKVRPLFVEQCQKCHGLDEKKTPRGGLDMRSRAALLRGGDSGPALAPGEPGKSLLLTAMKYHDENLTMPPAGKRPDAEIEAVEKWIKAGAPWPDSKDVVDAPKSGPLFTEEQKKFWAFQKLQESSFKFKEANPVDGFIRAKLKEAKLPPAPPVDKRLSLIHI